MLRIWIEGVPGVVRLISQHVMRDTQSLKDARPHAKPRTPKPQSPRSPRVELALKFSHPAQILSALSRERLETTSQPSSLQKLHDKIPNHVLQLRHLPGLSVCSGMPTLGHHATQGLGFRVQGCFRGFRRTHLASGPLVSGRGSGDYQQPGISRT